MQLSFTIFFVCEMFFGLVGCQTQGAAFRIFPGDESSAENDDERYVEQEGEGTGKESAAQHINAGYQGEDTP